MPNGFYPIAVNNLAPYSLEVIRAPETGVLRRLLRRGVGDRDSAVD